MSRNQMIRDHGIHISELLRMRHLRMGLANLLVRHPRLNLHGVRATERTQVTMRSRPIWIGWLGLREIVVVVRARTGGDGEEDGQGGAVEEDAGEDVEGDEERGVYGSYMIERRQLLKLQVSYLRKRAY